MEDFVNWLNWLFILVNWKFWNNFGVYGVFSVFLILGNFFVGFIEVFFVELGVYLVGE